MDKNYYKISPELKEFVIKAAQERRELGCRKISALVREQFKIEISKSSIAAILKAGLLNQPVGRRSLYKKPPPPPLLITNNQLPSPLARPRGEGITATLNMGCWFLKAADLCLGGSEIISKIINTHIKDAQGANSAAKNEVLLYLSLFGRGLDGLAEDGLKGLIGKELTKEEIKNYIEQLKAAAALDEESLKEITILRQEALALQCVLEDKSSFYIDAGGHNIWPGLRIPTQLSVGLCKAKNRLNEIVEGKKPLILQAAPGFEAPLPAFINFINSFQAQDASKALSRISIISNDNKSISETSQPILTKKRHFIFGLWPWQYQKFRQIPSPNQISLTDPATGQKITLRAIEEERFTLLTNIEESISDDSNIRLLFRERWPDSEIGYQNLLERIGHLSTRRNMVKENEIMSNLSSQRVNPLKLLIFWRQELSRYCQDHFFPAAYQGLDFSVLKERFYGLKGQVKEEGNNVTIVLYVPENFPYFEDLCYSCLRVSEADIRLSDGRRIKFTCAGSIA